MPNQLNLSGANPGKQTKLAPLYNGRWSNGIWTNRSPLRDASTSRIVEKFYGAAGDALIAGSNVEITNRLTLARRPGNTAIFGGAGYSNVDRFYDFRVFGPTTEQIIIMIDTANALYALTNLQFRNLVWNKSAGAGQSFMQSVGNTLFFGDGVDNKKWLQTLVTWQANAVWNTPTTPYLSTFLIDPNGNIQQLTGTVVGISSVFVSNDVVEVFTTSNISGTISVGDEITFPQGMVASFLNGQTVTLTQVGSTEFIFNFVAPNYSNTNENSGTLATVFPGDGTPTSGATPPMWNFTVPSIFNNFQGGQTIDGSVVWTNRGNPVENWGIQPPTGVLTPRVQGDAGVWEENTFYSLVSVVLDSNGNLQQVFKAGTTGATPPQWNTVLGSITYNNGVNGPAWELVASAAMLNWQSFTNYPTGSFIVGNASGTNCLFQLGSPTTPYLAGTVTAILTTEPHSGAVGDFQTFYPFNQGDATRIAYSLTGFDFTITGTGTGGFFTWNTINSAGQTIGTTNPFAGVDVSDINLMVTGTLQVPVAGTYTFSVTHGDGLMWGIGGGATLVSGTALDNPITGLSLTAAMGYPYFQAGNNVNVTFNGNNAWVDSYVVQFPSSGTYPVEFNLARWDKVNAGMTVTCNGQTISGGQPSSGGISGSAEPTWPSWSLGFSPEYPSVLDSNPHMQWNNIGPLTDFTWYPNIDYTLPDTTIVDGNSNEEGPYRTGKTGSTAPTFATSLDALTNDPSPNLVWINLGPVSLPPVGTLTVSNGGWKYAISLVNTLDDTVSNATPVSAATGNFTGAFGVVLSPGDGLDPSKIDPQADYVAIWRTTDGESQPFLIPGNTDFSLPITLPLSTYLAQGYVDTTPDTGLNNLIEAPILGENTPPAAGASNLTYYLNRIFYSIGNTVYWTSGPDTPAGNGLNGTSPLNFDEQVSLVKRIVPTTKGAFVFTVSDINIIQGNGTSTAPIESAVPLLEGIGISSYNALDINGSIIGFFTTDSQFVILDPANGVSSAGFPIGDQLRLNNGVPGQSWNPANVYVTWHVNGEDQAWYVADGKNGWYRLMLTPAPEQGGYTWAPFATIVTGCKVVQSIETQPGVHNLLVAPVSGGEILARNLNSSVDGIAPYPANAVVGSAVLAQPGQVAGVLFITTESANIGTPMTLGILVDEALPYFTGSFDILKNWKYDPPNLLPSTSILSQRFYMDELADHAALMRHCQVQINWASENAQNEIFTLTIFGGYFQEE